MSIGVGSAIIFLQCSHNGQQCQWGAQGAWKGLLDYVQLSGRTLSQHYGVYSIRWERMRVNVRNENGWEEWERMRCTKGESYDVVDVGRTQCRRVCHQVLTRWVCHQLHDQDGCVISHKIKLGVLQEHDQDGCVTRNTLKMGVWPATGSMWMGVSLGYHACKYIRIYVSTGNQHSIMLNKETGCRMLVIRLPIKVYRTQNIRPPTAPSAVTGAVPTSPHTWWWALGPSRQVAQYSVG